MDHGERSLIIAVEALELPPGAYERAKRRYESLGEWFSRKKSTLAANDPHIFVQGHLPSARRSSRCWRVKAMI